MLTVTTLTLAVRDEHTRTIEPARAAEALALEHTLTDRVNQTYGLAGIAGLAK